MEDGGWRMDGYWEGHWARLDGTLERVLGWIIGWIGRILRWMNSGIEGR
jgi:hypothetical protein